MFLPSDESCGSGFSHIYLLRPYVCEVVEGVDDIMGVFCVRSAFDIVGFVVFLNYFINSYLLFCYWLFVCVEYESFSFVVG